MRKRKPKSIGEAVELALHGRLPEDMGKIREQMQRDGAEENCCNGIAYAMVLKALSGDKTAAEWVREAGGEKAAGRSGGGAKAVMITGEEDISD